MTTTLITCPHCAAEMDYPGTSKFACGSCGGHIAIMESDAQAAAEPIQDAQADATPDLTAAHMAPHARPAPAARASRKLSTLTVVLIVATGLILGTMAVIFALFAWVMGDDAARFVGPFAALLIMIVLGVIALALYFLPTFIAVKRAHRNVTGVVLVNFFFGWTVLGWVGALVWSTLAQEGRRA